MSVRNLKDQIHAQQWKAVRAMEHSIEPSQRWAFILWTGKETLYAHILYRKDRPLFQLFPLHCESYAKAIKYKPLWQQTIPPFEPFHSIAKAKQAMFDIVRSFKPDNENT